MAIVGDASVQFHGDTSRLDEDIEKALKRIKSRSIDLEANLDVSKASKKIRDLRYRTKGKPLEISLEANTKRFEASLAKTLRKRKLVVEADVKGANRAIDALMGKTKNLKIGFDVDSKSIDKAIEAASGKQIKPLETTIEIDESKSSNNMRKARELLNKTFGQEDIELVPVTDDAKAVLLRDKFNAVFRQVKTKIDITADDSEFIQDLYDLQTLAKNKFKAGVPVGVTDRDNWYAEIESLIKSVKDHKAEIPVEARVTPFTDDSDLVLERDRIRKALSSIKATIPLDADGDGVLAEAYAIATQVSTMAKAGIPVDAEEASTFRAKIEGMRARIESLKANIDVDVDLNEGDVAKTNAAIAFLTRRREIEIGTDWKGFAANVRKGAFETLTGIVPPQAVIKAIGGLIEDFSELSVQAGKFVTVAGTIGDAFLAMSGGLSVASTELKALPALLAVAPSAIGALTLATIATTTAFNGFGKAIKGDAKALAALPPAAREAAVELRNLKNESTKGVQEAFWEKAGKSLANMSKAILPEVNSALVRTGNIMGTAFGDAFNSIEKFTQRGGLKVFLENTNTGLEAMMRNLGPLSSALLDTAAGASRHFVRLGGAIDDVSRRFTMFLNSANASGKMDTWIEEAVQTLKDLGNTAINVGGIISGLGKAAEAAGIGGFGSLEEKTRRLSDALNSVSGQKSLTDIFRGAGQGAEALSVGVGKVMRSLGEMSGPLGDILRMSGEISGIVFSNFADFISKSDALDGVKSLLSGVRDAAEDLGPAFVSAGNIIGDLGKIGGEVIRNIAPGLTRLVQTIESVLDSITPGIVAAMPLLNQMVQVLTYIPSEAVKELAKAFAALPSGAQASLVAITGMGLALSRFSGTILNVIGGFKAVSAFGRTMSSSLADGTGKLAAAGAGARAARDSFVMFAGGADEAGRKTKAAADSAETASRKMSTIGDNAKVYHGSIIALGNAGSDAAGKLDSAGSAASRASGHIGGLGKVGAIGKSALTGIGTAASGLMSALGGPWGLAIAGIAAGVTKLSSETGNAKTNFENLGQVAQSSGRLSEESINAAVSALESGQGASDWIYEIDPTSKSVAEGFQSMGLNMRDVAKESLSAGGQAGELEKKLRAASEQTGTFSGLTKEQADALGLSAGAIGLNKNELDHMADALERTRTSTEGAKTGVNTLSDGLKGQLADLQSYTSAMDIIQSSTTSLGEKQQAYAGILTKSKGEVLQFKDAQAAYYGTLEQNNQALTQAGTAVAGYGAKLLDANGQIAVTDSASARLHTSISNSAGSIRDLGVAAYQNALDQGKSVQEAAKIGAEAIKQPYENFKQTLMATTGMTAEQVDKIAASFGILPKEFETKVSADISEAKEAQAVLEKLTQGDYTAVLDANDSGIVQTLAEVTGSTNEWAKGDYEAVFKAIAGDMGSVEEAEQFLKNIAGKDYKAAIEVLEKSDPDLAERVKRNLDIVDGEVARGAITVEDQNAFNRLNDFSGSIEKVNGRKAEAVVSLFGDTTVKSNLTEVHQKLDGLSGKEATAALNATDNASRVIEAAGLKGTEFDNHNFMAGLDADSKMALMAINNANENGGRFDGKEFKAQLGLMGVETTDDEMYRIHNKLQEVFGKDWQTKLSADGSAVEFAAAVADGDLSTISDKVYEGKLTADASDVAGKVGSAKTTFDTWASLKGEAQLNAKDNASPLIGTLGEAVKTGIPDSKTTSLNATDNASGTVNNVKDAVNGIPDNKTSTVNASDFASSILGNVKNMFGLVPDSKNTSVNATDNATPTISGISGSLSSVPDSKSTSLNAQDNASPIIGAIGSSIFGLPLSKNTFLSATDGASGTANAVSGAVNSVPGQKNTFLSAFNNATGTVGLVNAAFSTVPGQKNTSLNASNNTAPGVAGAQGTINSLQGVTRGLNATNNTAGPTGSAQATMNTLQGVIRKLEAENAAGRGTASTQATINSLRGVTRDLEAANRAAGGTSSAQATINSLRGKEVDARANARGQTEVESLKSSIAGLAGKTVDVVTNFVKNFITRGRNEDGGLWMNDSQVFADGGVVQQTIVRSAPKVVQAFAGGGFSENHIAQISKPSGTYRVWAEPETEGEAYIPLAKRKRARSVNILEEVAQIFGYQLVKTSAHASKKFANGGLEMYNKTSTGNLPQTNETVYNNGNSNNISVTVNPSASIDEVQTSNLVVKELQWNLMKANLGKK